MKTMYCSYICNTLQYAALYRQVFHPWIVEEHFPTSVHGRMLSFCQNLASFVLSPMIHQTRSILNNTLTKSDSLILDIHVDRNLHRSLPTAPGHLPWKGLASLAALRLTSLLRRRSQQGIAKHPASLAECWIPAMINYNNQSSRSTYRNREYVGLYAYHLSLCNTWPNL